MPTYELRCRECGESFELFLMRMLRSDDLLCPRCGSTEVDRGVGGGVLGSGTRSAGGASASSGCGSRGFA